MDSRKARCRLAPGRWNVDRANGGSGGPCDVLSQRSSRWIANSLTPWPEVSARNAPAVPRLWPSPAACSPPMTPALTGRTGDSAGESEDEKIASDWHVFRSAMFVAAMATNAVMTTRSVPAPSSIRIRSPSALTGWCQGITRDAPMTPSVRRDFPSRTSCARPEVCSTAPLAPTNAANPGPVTPVQTAPLAGAAAFPWRGSIAVARGNTATSSPAAQAKQ